MTTIENFEKIHRIAGSEIPVERTNPLYETFNHRRMLCERFLHDDDLPTDLFEMNLNYLENRIKKYFYL